MTDQPTHTNGSTPARPYRRPGRPYFEPAGLDHLRGRLDAERADLRSEACEANDCQVLLDTGGTPKAIDGLGKLRARLDALAGLYGEPLRATIDTGLVEEIGADVWELANGFDQLLGEANRVADRLAAAEDEMDRLERELAAAQVHYDEQRTARRQLDDQTDRWRHQAAWCEAFADALDSALERHLPAGATSLAAIRREARRKADRVANPLNAMGGADA